MTIPAYIPLDTGTTHSLTTSSVVSITAPNGGTGVLLQSITGNVRWTLTTAALDGNPTTTARFQLEPTTEPIYVPLPGGVILRMIAEASGVVAETLGVRALNQVS